MASDLGRRSDLQILGRSRLRTDHARARLGRHHPDEFHVRQARLGSLSRLRRGAGWHTDVHASSGARTWASRRPRQCHCPFDRPQRENGARDAAGPSAAGSENAPVAAPRGTGGHCGSGDVPCFERLVMDHGPGDRREWRQGHALSGHCLDGTRVVNYAQSEDMSAAKRVIEHLQAKGLLKGNKSSLRRRSRSRGAWRRTRRG
ncbi:hypothetical protein CHELA40_12589 [Chelatococcus asaccharovorans]|nr:hypothetical protein CHELA40_12589 [Chelatococcus asaccharovorans]CAH1682233.1 hypothetical protein CHELA17_63026 [Chelatococcus asaccharovorans]